MGYLMKVFLFVVLISFTLYLVGSPSMWEQYQTGVLATSSANTDFVAMILGFLFNGTNIAIVIGLLGTLIVGGILVGQVTGGGQFLLGNILAYAIPAAGVMGLINFFILPIGGLLNETPIIPIPFNYLLVILINGMIIGGILNFVTGRDS